MNRWLLITALGLGTLALLTVDEAPAQARRNAGWLKDYSAARAAARQSGKPMFLVFR